MNSADHSTHATVPLFDPTRHEALREIAWDEVRVRDTISMIVADTEAHWTAERFWPMHDLDVDPDEDASLVSTPLYFGAAGVIWALHYLQDHGVVTLERDYLGHLDSLLALNASFLSANVTEKHAPDASFMIGQLSILMMADRKTPTEARQQQMIDLIVRNQDHPSRELMWGAPGNLLATLFMHERTGDARWADLFRTNAAALWSQLHVSRAHGCRYWPQRLYGRETSYVDAVHGFVGTASPLIRGRHLLGEGPWRAWADCIVETVRATAIVVDGRANWRPQLFPPPTSKPLLVQHCHGSPGFISCLSDMPGTELDDLLVAAGETTWVAGPLVKGSNLCHGTGGNGHAFIRLFERTGDRCWLDRARAFAMHGIEQLHAARAAHGQLRYSLWTGDLGFAVHLWDCLRAQAAWPTLDVFD